MCWIVKWNNMILGLVCLLLGRIKYLFWYSNNWIIDVLSKNEFCIDWETVLLLEVLMEIKIARKFPRTQPSTHLTH
jgi:nitrate/TMAO reductase-like tetraheme cytochrome c subunit